MILSLVAVVVVLVLAILGPAVGNVFSSILNVADAYGGGAAQRASRLPLRRLQNAMARCCCRS
jgi:hypothetical protein